MALITTANYKIWKGISSTSYDTRIAVYIAQAQSFADTYTGRVLEEQEDIVETMDGTGGPYLFLRNAPISSVSSVVQLSGSSESTIPSSQYRFATNEDSRSSICRVSSADWSCPSKYPTWQRGCLNWRVTYTAGYTVDSIPANLERVLYMLVDVIFDASIRDIGSGDVQSESLGSYSYTLANAVEKSERIRSLLGPYVRLL